MLYDDIIIKISEKLKDKEKIYLSMVSIKFNKIKYKMRYTELVTIAKIESLPYFDNFENVEISNIILKCPKNAKYIHLLSNQINILPCVTHLTFDDNFNQSIKDCIPSSVTHLKFCYLFDQSIKDCIPSSVIYLKFGHDFDQSIKDCIPSSVTHLTFG